jgi:hypothetical protein
MVLIPEILRAQRRKANQKRKERKGEERGRKLIFTIYNHNTIITNEERKGNIQQKKSPALHRAFSKSMILFN